MDTKDKNQDHYHSDDVVNKRNEIGNRDDLDSKVNTHFSGNAKSDESLTNDEPADTDPNAVPDKPKFKSDESR
jgi:hypothetical protein